MNTHVKPGLTIRQHNENGFVDLGLIVHDDLEADSYIWLPHPEKTEKRRRHHIPSARVSRISEFPAEARDRGLSLVKAQLPSIFRMSEEELRALAKQSTRTHRRNLQRSIDKMEEAWDSIQPFVEARPLLEMLDSKTVWQAASAAVKTGRVKSAPKFVRAVRAYVLYGCNKLALLPRWDLCNEVGGSKFPRVQKDGEPAKVPGRPNRRAANNCENMPTPVLSAADRKSLSDGWKKHKKRPYSVDEAYHLTLVEYFGMEKYERKGRIRARIPEGAMVPTLYQFRHHGPRAPGNKRASRINLGERWEERNRRGRTGDAAAGLFAFNQAAFIDFTTDDQTPVHPLDRRCQLKSTNTTLVVEPYTNYIAGIYNGFEPESAMTNLMAIAHAAMPKEEYCKAYGIELEDGEWLSLSFSRISGDGGPLKSEAGIQRLSFAETSAEFQRAYDPQSKAPVESRHQSLHRGVRHKLTGSTLGERVQRGERNPQDDACLTQAEIVKALIARILYLNNEDPVPHLLSLEMLREGVEPTRASILKWAMKKHYVATDSPNSEALIAACLPRLAASVDSAGIHVIDPRPGYRQRVSRLVFYSEQLKAEGYFDDKLRRKLDDGSGGRTAKIHINPSNLRAAWIEVGERLVKVERSIHDRQADELASFTLYDLLCMMDDEKLRSSLATKELLEGSASSTLMTAEINKSAKSAKRIQANAAAPMASGRRTTKGKREATAEVIAQGHLKSLGLGNLGPRVDNAGLGYFDLSYLNR